MAQPRSECKASVHLFPRRKAGSKDASPPAKGRAPILVSYQAIASFFGQPQNDAARQLGISLTTLKQVCRKLGLTRWPYMRPCKSASAKRMREAARAAKHAQAKEKAKNVIVEKLIEINPFQVPQALVDDEVRNLLIRVGAVDPKNTKFEDIPVEPFRESFGEMAAKRVKANIVTDMVAQAEKITPNDEDMRNAFQEVAAQYRVSEAEARKMFTGRSLIHLAVEITRSKTQDMLVDKANVTYVKKG